MNDIATKTRPSCSPADFKRRILLCVAGLSPQVITETLYELVTRKDRFIPTCIYVITTREGAHRIRLNLLEPDPNEQHFHRLCAELDIDPESIAFHIDTICRNSPPTSVGIPAIGVSQTALASDIAVLDDIRSITDNEIAADAITSTVRTLTADPEAAIHASIAGGRKTMGFYLGYTLSLFGREQDRLSHVLVSPPFEAHPQFYYPPQSPKVLRDRDNRPIHTGDASITLADIPFVRLRGHLDSSILGEGISYSETVARTQRNVNPPHLELDTASKLIDCGGCRVELSPSLFAFYAWFARRLLAGRPGVHWAQPDAAQEYLAEYARVVGDCSGDYENACKSLQRGMDQSFYEPKISKINRRLENMLGKGPARPYLLSNIGTVPGTRYRLKGLTLKHEQVHSQGEHILSASLPQIT